MTHYNIVELGKFHNESGNKALNLSKIKNLGIKIAKGVVVIPSNTGKTSEEIYFSLVKLIPMPWILRSSSKEEDSSNLSFAGCMTSIGPIDSFTEFNNFLNDSQKATPNASHYGEKFNVSPAPPSIIIQSFVKTQKSGVAFFPDPWNELKIRIESGSSSEITSGIKHKSIAQVLSPQEKEDILKSALIIQKSLNFKTVDLEWGIDHNNELFIFQARNFAGKTKQENIEEMFSSKRLPSTLTLGTWINDLEHNPFPVSFLHEEIVNFIHKNYLSTSFSWNGYIFYKENSAKFQVDINDLFVAYNNLKNKTSFNNALNFFGKFVALYLSRETPIHESSTSKNLLISILKKVTNHSLPGLGENPIHHDLEFINERFIEEAGFLPHSWDIASLCIKDTPDIVKNFITMFLPRLEKQGAININSENELDDLIFAKAMNHFRNIIIEIGDKFFKDNILSKSEDIFNLSINEIMNPHKIDTKMISKRIQRNINLEFLSPPVRIKNGNIIFQEKTDQVNSEEGSTIVSGFTRGRVHKLHSPNPVPLSPYIAIVDSLTPQDIIKLLDCKGVIMENSSRLSHGVIIATELGIPALAGVRGICNKLNEGDIIELNSKTKKINLIQTT